MQSTSSAIAAAAMSGADLSAKASSDSTSTGSNGFNAAEAESWMQARWKAAQKSEVYKAAPGTAGSAWGPNKKTINERFTNDLLKASSAITKS